MNGPQYLSKKSSIFMIVLGGVLVVLGAIFLLDKYNIVPVAVSIIATISGIILLIIGFIKFHSVRKYNKKLKVEYESSTELRPELYSEKAGKVLIIIGGSMILLFVIMKFFMPNILTGETILYVAVGLIFSAPFLIAGLVKLHKDRKHNNKLKNEYSWLNTVSENTKTQKTKRKQGDVKDRALKIISIILMGVGIILMLISLARNDIGIMALLGFVLSLIGTAAMIGWFKNYNISQKKIQFYQSCVQDGIRECAGEKEIQKASLIARQKQIPFTDIVALFNECKALVDQQHQEFEDSSHRWKINEEKHQYETLTRFANFIGRGKRIAMLRAEYTEALAYAKKATGGTNALISATQQKELDWATHGGIASGIAGPAAGLATALDIQAKNEKIRAQNEANLKAFAPVYLSSMNSESLAWSAVDRIKAQIAETETKLVASDSAENCFERLRFSQTSVKTSETGTCFVETKVKLDREFCIFGDVNAVVDGTVIACILDGQQEIGRAPLVLPKWGVSSTETTLSGCCLFCGKPNAHYSVRFEAGNLWAMEK